MFFSCSGLSNWNKESIYNLPLENFKFINEIMIFVYLKYLLIFVPSALALINIVENLCYNFNRIKKRRGMA